MGYITFENVCKHYQTGDTVVKAVDNVSFEIEKGEFCVVLGPSGAGKTTVFNMRTGVYRITEDPAFTHFCPADGGVLAEECIAALKEFFAKKRGK